jgi:hypothetical protein
MWRLVLSILLIEMPARATQDIARQVYGGFGMSLLKRRSMTADEVRKRIAHPRRSWIAATAEWIFQYPAACGGVLYS